MVLIGSKANTGAFGLGWSAVLPFSPADLNPQLWLDASDTSTITEAGGAVSQWDNKGLLGNFVQATAASQPTTGVSTQNGLNVIDFASDFLEASDTNEWKFMHDGTVVIWACVIKLGVVANPNAFYNIFMNANNAGEIGFRIGWDDRTPENEEANHEVWNASTRFIRNQASIWPANSFFVASVISDPLNATLADRSEMFANAGGASKNNTLSGSPSTSNPTNAARIGADDSGTNVLTGSIAEMIVVSGTYATEANRVLLRDYLNEKWSVY